MRIELFRQHLDLGSADDLVGDEDLLHSEAAHDTCLGDRRGRHAPGAGGELTSLDVRGHRRLAVWRERHSMTPAIRRHRTQVVLERRLLQQQ